MFRFALVLVCLAGCVTDAALDGGDPAAESAATQAVTVAFHREHVTGDVYHYSLVVPVGRSANAAIRVHRIVRELAPFVPRHAAHAAMLLHGDFANFLTDFAPTLGTPASPAPGLAPDLAAHDVDVWGVDRRWALTPTDGDTSDYATMGVAQELGDIRAALALARTTRAADGSGTGKLALVGFSHGAELAYAYSASEAARPAADRHVGALASLDFLAAYAPADADLRTASCANAATEYAAVVAGQTDSPNDFFIAAGNLDRTAPADASPLLDGFTNRGTALLLAGQTYEFAPITPAYHLLQPTLAADGNPIALAETSELAADQWFAGAPPHQSMLEAADLDAILCGQAPLPVDAPLGRIRVPLLYIGAAGAVGSYGLYTTTQVSSTDVTTLVVQRFADDQRIHDFGHGDLLFGASAPARAWQPLASWLAHH